MGANADVGTFLTTALAIETEIAGIYERLADLSGDPPVRARLREIAAAEVNHANAIRRGLAYFEAWPDLFAGTRMAEAEASSGLAEIRAFRAALDSDGLHLSEGLKALLSFELRFERVHLDASVVTTDPSLKRLFIELQAGDRSHVQNLRGLIDSLD